jgi:DNA-binding MarR family transcriptional regulator
MTEADGTRGRRRGTEQRGRSSLTVAGRRAHEARFGSSESSPGSESTLLGIALTRAAHAHGTLSEDLVHRHHDRNWMVFRVLYVLWVFEPMSARDVVETMQVSRQTASNILRSLESEGLVTRERNPDDARLITIRLTPEGRAGVEQALEDQFRLDSAIFDVLAPEEREQLAEMLGRIRGRIRAIEQSEVEVDLELGSRDTA